MTVPNDKRNLIIEAYLNNTKKQISSMFDIKYYTICAIIRVYENKDRYK